MKSGIWEMKGGKYTKTLAKTQVIRTFRMRDIRRNVLPKFMVDLSRARSARQRSTMGK